MKLHIQLQTNYDNSIPNLYSDSLYENEEDSPPIEEEIILVREEAYSIETTKNIFRFLKLIEELLDDESISWDWGGERSGENHNLRIKIITYVQPLAEESFKQVRKIFEEEKDFTVIDKLPEIPLTFPNDIECYEHIDERIWAVEVFCSKKNDIVWERILPETNGGSGFGELRASDWITIASILFQVFCCIYHFKKKILHKKRIERIIRKIERKENIIRVNKKPALIHCNRCHRNEYCFNVDFQMKNGKVSHKNIYTSLNGHGKIHF